MKVVILNTVPYGSTGRISKNIGKQAEKMGDEVYYVYGWTKKKRKSSEKNEIIATSFLSKAMHGAMTKLTGLDGVYSSKATRKLVRFLKKIQPDIVHLHIMHDYFLDLNCLYQYFAESKVKVIWTFHDCWAFTGGCMYFTVNKCNNWIDGCKNCSYRNALIGSASKRTEYAWNMKRTGMELIDDLTITVPSDWLGNLVKSSLYKEQKVKVIHNGLNLDIFKPRNGIFKQDWHLEKKQIVLGVAFDWGYRKGLDVFVELSKLLPEEYQIILVGIKKEQKKILPDNIITIPKTSNQEQLVELYSDADVFVNPTREEVFGMVNIEALACGTPVVMFNTGGAPESIDSTCGIVVNDMTIESLYKEIIYVCQKRPFTKDACINRAKKFDEQLCYSKYLSLYHDN